MSRDGCYALINDSAAVIYKGELCMSKVIHAASLDLSLMGNLFHCIYG